MDKVIDYPTLLKDILSKHVELCNRRPNQDVENFLVVDEKKSSLYLDEHWLAKRRSH
jgi:hypothetical protein